MRPRIEALNVDAMEWQALGPPGLFSKLLSRDPETGARTALQRLDPGAGYAPPQTAHYHHTYEEILGISGWFSFDQRTWVRPLSYVFHPPCTVHGFRSDVPEESWFLSRVGQDLDFNFVPEPEHDDFYTAEGAPPARAVRAIAEPIREIGWTSRQIPGGSAPLEWCELSSDPGSGEGSALVRLPEGWRFETTGLDDYLEMFVVDGALFPAGSAAETRPRHSYFFYPPGERIGPLVSHGETLAYVNFGKAIAS